jgi:sulfur-carrier protein adenylyltransferase/sulfurtransferase
MQAARQLAAMGYRGAVSMGGGFVRWKAEGRPWRAGGRDDAPHPEPAAPGARYSRQLVMPEVGPAGQARLAAARVLVVGAGGLGSPSLLYLAAAGVGTIGVVDFDTVEMSNLQRQVVHTHGRLGRQKTESAASALRELNPDVTVVGHDELLDAGNAGRLVAGHDVVIDGSDTFATRYALNDACAAAGIPLVHASVYRFEGQLTVFAPPAGPCYRCLFPEPPADAEAFACAVTGVLGVVPGVMGLLQATEALKLILGLGRPLIGRLLVHDALEGTFEEVRLQADPACPVCSGLGAAAAQGRS